MKRILLSIAIAATLSGCNTVSDWMGSTRAPATAANGVLVGPGGMTLYTFDRDVAASGKSACNGPCATNWPPLLATSDAKSSGDWSVIARDGGARQWAYKGAPLYYWAKDTKPGERTGDGFNGVWRVAKP